MYKDKDKQREANKERQRRYKDRQKALPKQGVTPQKALLSEGVTQGVTLTMEEKAARFRALIADPPKRGKDIKTFADLPDDVQMTIEMMSTTDGKLDEAEKAKRTTIAVNYQHTFPNRYYAAGLDVVGYCERNGQELAIIGSPND